MSIMLCIADDEIGFQLWNRCCAQVPEVESSCQTGSVRRIWSSRQLPWRYRCSDEYTFDWLQSELSSC